MAWTSAEAKKRRAEILAALQAAKGNVTRTAEALGTSRTTLYNYAYMLGLEREFGLDKEAPRESTRSPRPSSGPRTPANVKVSEDLWDWTRIQAIKEKRSASDVVEEALERLRAAIEAAGK